jgi:hypothetical protein
MAHFELVSELMTLGRRDFALASSALLNPFNANPVIEGEWLELDSNYALARGAPGGLNNEGLNGAVFPVHTERGRYDTQVIGKTNVLMLGMFEADTKVADLTGAAVGDALTVQDVTYLGVTKRGLRKTGAVAGRIVVGYVTKLPGNGIIRFVHFGNHKAF